MFDFFLASLPIMFILLINLVIKVSPWIKDQIDIVSGGVYSDLHDTYSLVYAHMNENSDQWKFSKDYARFPKSGGAAIISITKENDNPKLQISIDHINEGKYVPFKGYFNKIFKSKISDAFSEQSSIKTVQVLFPDRKLVMLTDESKHVVNNDFLLNLKEKVTL